MMRTMLLSATILTLTLSLHADVIVLNNGEKIECEILQEGKFGIRIKDKNNKTRSIKNGDVKEIIRGEASWKKFDGQWKSVKKDDVDGLLALARLAKENDLPKRLTKALKAIFKADKDHGEARELGDYVKDEKGNWLTREQLRRAELKKKIAKMPNLKPGREDYTIGGEKVVMDIPRGYNKAKPHPVVFLFHGAGDNARYFLQWYIGGFKPKGYILISCENNDAQNDAFGGIIKELDTQINYDPDRLYTFGFSQGSYTAAHLPFKYKNTFAAAAFGGGGLASESIPKADEYAHGNIVWCGTGDVNHYPIAQKAVKILKEQGYDVVWKSFGGGHTDVPGGLVKEVFAYFDKHKRKKKP